MNRRHIKWILTALAVSCVLLSCVVGRYPLTVREILRIVSGRAEAGLSANVFLNIRLPRALIVAISGAALAAAGQVYQRVFRNPLVSPDVLGVSGGCSAFAILGILSGSGALATQGLAFFGGLLAVAGSMALSRAMRGERAVSMILSGIVVGALANSAIMLMKYLADPTNELAAIEYWLMGSFHTARWGALKFLLPVSGLCFTGLFLLRYPLQLIALGDDEAGSLGVNVPVVRIVCLLCATAMVASSVSVSGIVSWIGLIVPHMVRRIAHADGSLLYESAMGGAILLTVADLLARGLTTAEVPISILTSLMGAAFLAFVLIARRAREGGAA